MSIGKIFKRAFVTVLLIALAYGIYFASQALPIITGYSAKNLCSCVMLAGRAPADVIAAELGRFPLSLGAYEVNYSDSSATGTIFGLAEKKAIYRKGLGCSLLSEITEDEFRNQRAAAPRRQSVALSDNIAFPYGNYVSTSPDSLLSSTSREMLDAVVDSAFMETGPKKLRHTRAIVVVHNGRIIAERYAEGFTADTRLTGWSMAKSITSSLIGVLVKQGKLDVNKRAPIAAWANDERKNITLNDMLHMSSGLDWVENYSMPSGATNMLFRKKDMGVYASEAPLAETPGKTFYYSSGTTNILSRIIRNTVGEKDYYDFPYRELLDRIGMRSVVLEPDAGGTFVGSSYAFATARDWARFGLLYLNDGVWNGTRILPEGWVTYATTPATSAPLGQYGAQFWLNAGAPGDEKNRYYPSVSTDLYWADGFEGQNVFILPSEKLVVVKLSLSQGEYLDDDAFLKGIVDALHR